MSDAPVGVYECYVESVAADSKVLNARSRTGKRFKNVSYLFPFIAASGTGIDCTPEVGAECVVLAGPHGLEYVIGFRQGFTVNPLVGDVLPLGSIAMRVRGEDGSDAHVVLVKGGTLVMGTGKSCRTLYSPVDKSILHIFNNWEVQGPGGFVKWSRESGSESVKYEAEYRTKVDKNNPGFRVKIGISGERPLEVTLDRGDDDAYPPMRVSVSPDGTLSVTGNVLAIKAIAEIRLDAPSVLINGRPVLAQKDAI